MKLTKNICIALLLLASLQLDAQSNVGIGNSSPDPSAKLEVNSTSSGFLMPRMTEAQRNAIISPASGLMVYQTDNSDGTYYFDGTLWRNLSDNMGNHTATQVLNMDTNKIVNVPTPVNGLDAVNKDYVDAAVSAGGGGTGCCSSASEMSAQSAAIATATTAFHYCDTLTEGGNSDWRPPTIKECIDGLAGFTTIPGTKTSDYLWTRSVTPNNGFYHYWLIRLSNGNIAGGNGSSTYSIRCVRGN